MRKTVLLSITGISKTNGIPDDAIKLFTTGYLSGEGDSWKLKYSEIPINTRMTTVKMIFIGVCLPRLIAASFIFGSNIGS